MTMTRYFVYVDLPDYPYPFGKYVVADTPEQARDKGAGDYAGATYDAAGREPIAIVVCEASKITHFGGPIDGDVKDVGA